MDRFWWNFYRWYIWPKDAPIPKMGTLTTHLGVGGVPILAIFQPKILIFINVHTYPPEGPKFKFEGSTLKIRGSSRVPLLYPFIA